MIKPDQIPDEVVEAAARALKDHPLVPFTEDAALVISRASIAAAINAWPSMRVDDTYRWLSDVAIILPMEDKNAKS